MIRNIDREKAEQKKCAERGFRVRISQDAYERAEKVLKENEIDIASFSDLYGQDNIARDKAYVKEKEARFLAEDTPSAKQQQAIANVFEAIFLEHSELSDWLGGETRTFRASRFDDIANGVDTIVEVPQDDYAVAHLAAAIDVTFAKNVSKKLARVRGGIDTGTLATVKYFRSEAMNFRGELKRVPHIVVVIAPETVQQLVDLWQNGGKKQLGEHFVQFQILDEIILQLDAYRTYAHKKGYGDLADIYERSGKLFKKLRDTRRASIKDTGVRDTLYNVLEESLQDALR